MTHNTAPLKNNTIGTIQVHIRGLWQQFVALLAPGGACRKTLMEDDLSEARDHFYAYNFSKALSILDNIAGDDLVEVTSPRWTGDRRN